MPNKKKSSDGSVGRVIKVSKEVNILFKQILIDLEKTGCTKKPDQIASEIFASGVYAMLKEVEHEEA